MIVKSNVYSKIKLEDKESILKLFQELNLKNILLVPDLTHHYQYKRDFILPYIVVHISLCHNGDITIKPLNGEFSLEDLITIRKVEYWECSFGIGEL